MLLADPQLLPVVDAGAATICANWYWSPTTTKAFWRRASSLSRDPPAPEEEAMIAINYTSGTTGFPKGVMFTHRGGYLNALGEMIEHGLTRSSVYLWTLPLFHCNGWCFPWAVTAAGGAPHLPAAGGSGAHGGIDPEPRASRICAARPSWSAR